MNKISNKNNGLLDILGELTAKLSRALKDTFHLMREEQKQGPKGYISFNEG